MAKEWVSIQIDNKWEPTNAQDIKPEQYGLPIRCNGCINGNENKRCMAPMTVRRKRGGSGNIWFGLAKKEFPHAVGCENDRRQKYKILAKYDCVAKNEQKDEFLAKLIARWMREDNVEKTQDDRLKKEGYEEYENFFSDDEDWDKKIKKAKKLPSKLTIMTNMVETLGLDHEYMNKPIKEWVVDHRTCMYHRKKGTLTGIMIVVGKLWNPSSLEVKRHADEWVIVECAYNSYKGRNWVFCLKCNDKAMSKLRKFSKMDGREKKYIVVCAEWKQDIENKNVFRSGLITSEMVEFMDIDLFQKYE